MTVTQPGLHRVQSRERFVFVLELSICEPPARFRDSSRAPFAATQGRARSFQFRGLTFVPKRALFAIPYGRLHPTGRQCRTRDEIVANFRGLPVTREECPESERQTPGNSEPTFRTLAESVGTRQLTVDMSG